jgi:hypothetical protein
MTDSARRILVASCIAALPWSGSAAPAWAAASSGRIVGSVTSASGRPAAGWDVLLVNASGDLVASAATSPGGTYEIAGLPPGAYRVGVRDLQGNVGAIAGPAARVAGSGAVRQDIRLVGGAPRLAPAAYGARADSWWDRQTRNQKIFTVVGIVVGVAALWAIVDHVTDDDQDEAPASPF